MKKRKKRRIPRRYQDINYLSTLSNCDLKFLSLLLKDDIHVKKVLIERKLSKLNLTRKKTNKQD